MAELILKNIAKSYGPVEVLRGIDLTIKTGELVVFVGPSGCGKSTLLRMIAGLERITGGTLEIDGRVMNDVPPARRGIAMVFQSYALYPHMTVRDNMAFAMKIARKPAGEIRETVENAARILQLTPYLDRLPKALSGGQRQRVAIGRAIVRNPKVFLFDEPLSNLDAALRVATRIEIAELKAQMPETTMVYVTHDQVEAMTLADRIVVLNGGGIEQVGSPLELYEKPANEFVARFIGSPAMNLLGCVVATTGAQTTVRIGADHVVEVPVTVPDGETGQVAKLGVRPEDLSLAKGDTALIEGTVEIVEALGEITLLYLHIPACETSVVAKLQGTHSIRKGDHVRLTALPAKLHLFDKNACAYQGGNYE